MDRKTLRAIIKEELANINKDQDNQGMDVKGASLPLQSMKQIGVIKPEYLPVVLNKVSVGQKLPPADNEYLAHILLKILASDDLNAMNQIFTAIKSLSAKKA
jgi:hypothetical protein